MAIRWTDTTRRLSLPALDRHALPGPEIGDTAMADGAIADVWVAPEVDDAVLAHLGAIDIEQGGLLIGDAHAHPDSGVVVHVRLLDCIPAEQAHGTAISLRMDSAVWTHARQRLARQQPGPGRLIVGWYHSHPGLGAFFSETDRRTQQAFFNQPYSIGWVIDPFRGQQAFYLGADCLPIPRTPAARVRPDGTPRP